MAPIARVSGLFHSFAASGSSGEQLPVLEDVSLQVVPGEFVTIIGPSGCGKTTLLRLLAGLLPSNGSRGSVEVAGRPVAGASEEIGFVFQQGTLIPWRTTIDNVALALELRNHGRLRPAQHEMVADMIRLVGLEGFETYYPRQLSGGMRQRVGMARALVVQPRLLLLDEPFGALDAQTRRLFQDELLRWRRATSFAGLLVTHDLDEALYLSDRILVMSARPGRIIEELIIDLPERADGVELRGTPGYEAFYQELWSLLRAENLRGAQT
jgi:NitT/TauT family transport system ATP-binding protein